MRNVKGIAVVLAPLVPKVTVVDKSGLDALGADIAIRGLQSKILVNSKTGEVIVGRRRFAAMQKMGIPITEDMIERV